MPKPLRRAPTIREVAGLAGVSIKTVSRVVNRERGVSPELTERVLDAVGLLGYQHNLAASSLRRIGHRTATIGLLLEDVSNPFASALHRAIEDVSIEHHTLVFAASSDRDPIREYDILQAFQSRRVDGLIVASTLQTESSLLPDRSFGRPLVFVDRPASVAGADTVTADNRAGSRTAVRHLAAQGHRRIAFLGDRRTIWTAGERYAGYIEGIASEGIRLDQGLVRQDLHNAETAEHAILDLLDADQPPSALFTAQNLITVGAIRALQRRHVQHSVALVGFDDILLADLLDPPVTVIAQDPTKLGRAAADLLFARLAGDERPPHDVVVPVRLIPRGSGEIPAS